MPNLLQISLDNESSVCHNSHSFAFSSFETILLRWGKEKNKTPFSYKHVYYSTISSPMMLVIQFVVWRERGEGGGEVVCPAKLLNSTH